jgi:DNA-binding GntR family transcriptional regulator
MEEAVRAGHSVFDLAWDFHRCLPKAAGNAAMAKIVDIIYEMIRAYEQPLYDQYFDAQKELCDHRELTQVLKMRDPERARAAMKAHLEGVNVHLSTAAAAEQAAQIERKSSD